MTRQLNRMMMDSLRSEFTRTVRNTKRIGDFVGGSLGRLGLFASVFWVLLVGTLVTASAWIGMTLLLRHHWPWDRHLDQNSSVASELDVTKIALSIVGGVGAAIALTVTYRRQRDIERGKFDERFASAAAQLGAPTAAQRLAGVYAIAALGDENPMQRQQCADLLCAYLRLPYDPNAGQLRSLVSERTQMYASGSVREERTYDRVPNDREVRLAIVEAIRVRLQPGSATNWSGIELNFSNATFDGGSFEGARFDSQTTFAGALFLSDFNFNGAYFNDLTEFSRAIFSSGVVSFSQAFFNGYIAFDDTEFGGGIVSFRAANFRERSATSFQRAKFKDGRVLFIGSLLDGVVDFNNAKLSGAQIDFDYARVGTGAVTFDHVDFAAGRITFDKALFNGGRITRDRQPFYGWRNGEFIVDSTPLRKV